MDTYDIYSAVLDHPNLSHPDSNQKYLVGQLSAVPMETEPRVCIMIPEAHRAPFTELLQDRGQQRKGFLLDRAFKIAKPYELLTKDQSDQFVKSRIERGQRTYEVELFRGAH